MDDGVAGEPQLEREEADRGLSRICSAGGAGEQLARCGELGEGRR